MRTATKLWILMGMAIAISSCMQNPKGEKVNADNANEISIPADAKKLSVNLETSKIEWLGTKPTGTHFGTLSISEGTLFVKQGKLVGGKFTMDMNSIVVLDIESPKMNENLVKHLKSADFFTVDSFPTATFEFAMVTPLENNQNAIDNITPTHRIEGNLTIKGITKKISFPAQLNFTDNAIFAVTPQFVLNRTDWNVNYGSKSIFANLKDNFIHDEMGIKITLHSK